MLVKIVPHNMSTWTVGMRVDRLPRVGETVEGPYDAVASSVGVDKVFAGKSADEVVSVKILQILRQHDSIPRFKGEVTVFGQPLSSVVQV